MDETRKPTANRRIVVCTALITAAMLLHGCGALEPVSDSGLPPPGEGVIRETPESLEQRQDMQKPAVLALVRQAHEKADNGQLDSAAAILERALRINPRDANLWHELAKVRLGQHKLKKAQNLAFKSNSHTSDASLRAKNWRIIQNVRQQMGDVSGAMEAGRKAENLQ